jgi:hypothetical protein
MVVVRRGIFLPFVVGMMVGGRDVEHHPDEPYHPHQQHTLNHSQCHGRRLPLSMNEQQLFMNTCNVTRPVGQSLWAACRFSRPVGPFSFSLLDGPHIR